MPDVVNLNKVRKHRRRADALAQATENRVKHGRTGGEKARDLAEAERRARAHAGAALESPPGAMPPK